MAELRTTCPDCETEMTSIKLIDATDHGMGSGVAHVELSYASAGTQASGLTRTIASAGKVKARMCPDCGRIVLYGSRSTGGLRSPD